MGLLLEVMNLQLLDMILLLEVMDLQLEDMDLQPMEGVMEDLFIHTNNKEIMVVVEGEDCQLLKQDCSLPRQVY